MHPRVIVRSLRYGAMARRWDTDDEPTVLNESAYAVLLVLEALGPIDHDALVEELAQSIDIERSEIGSLHPILSLLTAAGLVMERPP